MNKGFILFNLKEAKESIEQIISELENVVEYSQDDSAYRVDMQHLYWHINTAWNSRNESEAMVKNAADNDFDKWNEFPTDLTMSYE